MRTTAKNGLWICLLLAATIAAGGNVALQTADDRAVDAQEIRAHIERIFDGYITRNRQTIRETHSRDWRGFLRPSVSVIKGIDGYMRAAEAALSGPYGLKGYEFVEFDVVFYGDTAVVNYVAELAPRGVAFKTKLRVLDVYARPDGHWIQVASHTAYHPETVAALRQQPFPIHEGLREQLLEARERVWRAWFENGPDLEKLIPDETIAINNDDPEWKTREQILAGAAGFREAGGSLRDLKFPRTEIQLYGDAAILYSSYEMEFDVGGETTRTSGRATEVFVRRDGEWVNPGWHLDSGR